MLARDTNMGTKLVVALDLLCSAHFLTYWLAGLVLALSRAKYRLAVMRQQVGGLLAGSLSLSLSVPLSLLRIGSSLAGSTEQQARNKIAKIRAGGSIRLADCLNEQAFVRATE